MIVRLRRPRPAVLSTRARAVRGTPASLAVAACARCCSSSGRRPSPVAVSTRDLIELSKAGLGDEVLVALIEADGTVFNLDAPKILELRAAGVSERVITAMLRNASRRRAAAASAPTAATRGRGAAVIATDAGGAGWRALLRHHRREAAVASATADADLFPSLDSRWSGSPRRAGAMCTQPTTKYRGFGRFINDGWVDNYAPLSVPDVLIIGAGIVGCAAGEALTRQGASVGFIDPRGVGLGATQASAGMLTPYKEGLHHPVLEALGLRSLWLWDAFVDRLFDGSVPGQIYARNGSLDIAIDETEAAELQTLARRARRPWRGEPVSEGRRRQAARAGHRGRLRRRALLTPAHGYANAPAVTAALWRACERAVRR